MRHAVDAGAFFGGGFGFVAESGEEPGRAALVVVFGSGGCHAPAVAGCCSAGLADTGHAGAALLVELGGLGVVEEDVRRPTASVVCLCLDERHGVCGEVERVAGLADVGV